jgi:hypothetical protein
MEKNTKHPKKSTFYQVNKIVNDYVNPPTQSILPVVVIPTPKTAEIEE